MLLPHRSPAGLPGSIGNGVKVEVAGTMSNGVLKATKLKIRHVPGTGGPVSFVLIGNIGNFGSASSFRVRGQPVNAGGPGVVFVNGSAANLGNGVRVSIEGDQRRRWRADRHPRQLQSVARWPTA